jgi:hypothetical protein
MNWEEIIYFLQENDAFLNSKIEARRRQWENETLRADRH